MKLTAQKSVLRKPGLPVASSICFMMPNKRLLIDSHAASSRLSPVFVKVGLRL